MGVSITYDNFPLMSGFNYDHWCGVIGNNWGYFNSYQNNGKAGYYGRNSSGEFVWLMRLQLPSVINGQTVQKITSMSLTIYGQGINSNSGFHEAYIIDSSQSPSNDTPAGWVNQASWGMYRGTSGRVQTSPSVRELIYDFNDLSLTGERIYIVFFSSERSSSFEYNFNVGYPSLTIEADVITYGIRYHWFDNKFTGNQQDVAPGQQKLDSQGLQSTLINNYHYMVYGWCATPADLKTVKKRDMSGQKYYFEGSNYSIQNGLDLYPIGGPALDLGLKKYDISNHYLLNNTQYALEVPTEKKVGDSDSFGVGFWIDKPEVGEKSIPYVMQNNKWHMLGGSLKNRIDSGDDSYKLGTGKSEIQQAYYYYFVGRGTEGKLYSSDSTYYEVPITFIGDTALDLFKINAEYTWEQLRDYYGFTEFRDATIESSWTLYKAMPSATSLLADEQHPRAVKLTFPVYKINVKTFDWALSVNALYGQVKGIMKRWLVSSSNATIRTCFTSKGERLLIGIVNENELKKRTSALQNSYNEKNFLKELNLCGSYFTRGEEASSPLPIGTGLRYISVSKWQQLNQGGTCDFSQFSPIMPPSNEYGVVLTIPSSDSEQNIVLRLEDEYKLITGKIIGRKNGIEIPLKVYWVNQTPYIFYESGENWLEISNSNYDNVATLLKGFTGWEFNGKSYMSLKDLFIQEAETLCDNYTNTDKKQQSKITLKAGDTNGFAYIKELNGKIGQYYIYVKDKDTDSGSSLIRCTPYIKQEDGWLHKSYHNILHINMPSNINK